MPFYPYECPNGHEFEVVKPIRAIDEDETCPDCRAICNKSRRRIAPGHFIGASDWDTAHYSHGLGEKVRNNRHARQIAKSRGLEEVGNESPARMHKDFAEKRERKRQDRWNKDDSGPIETLTVRETAK